MRVLVISEDPAERRRATSALALHVGAEIVELESGEDARHRIIEGDLAADVLIIDGDLQPRGGFALLYDLQARADHARRALPPSIMLTSREQDNFLVTWSRADRALRKPIDPFELARVVDELAATAETA